MCDSVTVTLLFDISPEEFPLAAQSGLESSHNESVSTQGQ